MAASNYDIVIEQGTTWSLTIYLKDKYKLPIDLTGYSAKCQIRKPPPAEDAVLAEPVATIISPPTSGTLELKLNADVTAELTFLQANYDVILRAPSGEVIRLMQGKAKISPSITVF